MGSDDSSSRQGGRAARYFRHSVERRWNPHTIDLSSDVAAVDELSRREFTRLRGMVALFGAGEEAVTKDLAPLAIALDDKRDLQFVASHLNDEAIHAAFFERYWREVINASEKSRGLEQSDPTAERWFSPEYEELFARTESAMQRLLEADTPANRAHAYCHYHVTIEGILGQSGFYCALETFDGGSKDFPTLPGLVEGFSNIRRDEGRHVGFGVSKLKRLLDEDGVSFESVRTTVHDLSGLVEPIVELMGWKRGPGPNTADIVSYAADKRDERVDQLRSEVVQGIEK
ncbi:ribonucleotide-diphosphate reductase subunit beta (plasmid) [Haloferax sp. S1W]|uniref:ribonucleotide-diphosphate reductase subunit beta n=1 Tax=Haloferax sp. S1W TaxID=3377110 RepID=UPI0037C8B2D0